MLGPGPAASPLVLGPGPAGKPSSALRPFAQCKPSRAFVQPSNALISLSLCPLGLSFHPSTSPPVHSMSIGSEFWLHWPRPQRHQRPLAGTCPEAHRAPSCPSIASLPWLHPSLAWQASPLLHCVGGLCTGRNEVDPRHVDAGWTSSQTSDIWIRNKLGNCVTGLLV